MDAKEKLAEYKQRVEPHLEVFLAEKVREYSEISPFSGDFMRALEEFTLRGGKRLRAALIFYTYKMFGGGNDEAAIKLSMFVELLQSFLLIHDDIFDRSDSRRGGETMHIIYKKYAEQMGYGEASFFGEITATLNGDLANQLAYEIITEAGTDSSGGRVFDAERLLGVVSIVSKKVSEVIMGEVEDCLIPYKKEYTEKDVLNIMHYKTATYTYELPILVGAILQGATEREMGLLRGFSQNAGISFQIQDDYLGLFGDEVKLGKSTLSDLQEGKKTLFMLDIMDNGTDAQKAVIDKYLGKKDITLEQAEEVKTVVCESGALNRVRDRSIAFTEKAYSFWDQLEYKNTESWEFIRGVAEYMIRREK